MTSKEVNMATFTERLKELRQKNSLTQKELADVLGVSQGSYANWENGKRKPDYLQISDIAIYFNTSIDYLTGKIDKEYSDYIPQDFENKSHNELQSLIQQAEENIFRSLAIAKKKGVPVTEMKNILIELGFSDEKTNNLLRVLYEEQNLNTNSAPKETNDTNLD